jgi:hypothetical protein
MFYVLTAFVLVWMERVMIPHCRSTLALAVQHIVFARNSCKFALFNKHNSPAENVALDQLGGGRFGRLLDVRYVQVQRKQVEVAFSLEF